MIIEPYGQIEFESKYKQWFGFVDNICPDNRVELTISVDNKGQDISHKIELLNKFSSDYKSIITELYDLAYKKFKSTEFEVTRKEIEEIYFLCSVDLKEDDKTWWLTLEPHFNVTSIYNHFLRFTMVDRTVIWANFDINMAD